MHRVGGIAIEVQTNLCSTSLSHKLEILVQPKMWVEVICGKSPQFWNKLMTKDWINKCLVTLDGESSRKQILEEGGHIVSSNFLLDVETRRTFQLHAHGPIRVPNINSANLKSKTIFLSHFDVS
jgi:hypothetical protein